MLDPYRCERRGPVDSAIEHHLTRPQIPASFGDRTAAGSAYQLGELGLAADQDVGPFHERSDELPRAIGSPQAPAEVRVDHAKAARAFEQRDRRALGALAQHGRDARDEHGRGMPHRHPLEVFRLERARSRTRSLVHGRAARRLAEHRPGRPLGVAADPAEIDAVRTQLLHHEIAGGIRAEPAHPRGAHTEPYERYARVALGPAMGDERDRALPGRPGHRDDRAHRLAERDHVGDGRHTSPPARSTARRAWSVIRS
jgi:hypothetical protein